MTREQKLYSMTMKALVEEAEKLGIKIDKKGSKQKAVEKMLAAEQSMLDQGVAVETEQTADQEAEVVIDVEQTTETEQEVEAEAAETEAAEEVKEEQPKQKKKGGRKPTRKSFEILVSEIPLLGNVRLLANSKRTAVNVLTLGHKRIFGYDGVTLVVTRPEYLDGVSYDARNYGYRVEPTTENMLVILKNASKVVTVEK